MSTNVIHASTQPRPGLSTGPQHHSFIDALRGVAIIAVIVGHAPMCVPNLSDKLGDFLYRGSSGVQLFYALSAFTLCASFRARGGERNGLAKYALRRIFRIVPMFWVAIGLFIVVDMYATHWGPTHGFQDGGRMLLAAFLLHGFDVYAVNSVVPGGWSVAVEAQFYVLLPFLFWYATTLRRALVLVGLSLVISIAYTPVAEPLLMQHFAAGEREIVHEFTYFSLPTQLPCFMLGILAYRLLGPDRLVLAWLESRLPLRWIATGVVLLAVLPTRHNFPGHIGYGVAALALIYLLATAPVALLDNRFTRFYGRISYSAYLLHFAVLFLLETYAVTHFGPTPLVQIAVLIVAALTITACLASVTCALVEDPGIALGRKVTKVLLGRRTELQPSASPA